MADAPRPNSAIQVASQLKELWARQPKSRRLLAVVVGLGVVAVIAATQLLNRAERWTVVAETSPDDAQELFAALSSKGLPVRLRDGKVEVEAARSAEAQAIAASAGLPHAGKGWSLFDGSNLGQSSFAEQVNYVRALQDEISRSITTMAQVQSARVHLALGKRSVFKDQDELASASVALHLHPGQILTVDQVRGVRQVVANAVAGLKSDNVTVVDQHSNLLDSSAPGPADAKAELERSLALRVRSMLERIVGEGKVSVVMTADVDDRKMSQTEELYEQPGPAVMRSESQISEGDVGTGTVGGVAGTRGNLPGAPAATGTPASGSNARLQITKNYEPSKTVRQTVKPDIQLQRLHLAIVVDHKTDAAGKLVPRTPAELAELKALARQAAGLDDKRGDEIEVRSIAFTIPPELPAPVPPPDELPIVPIALAGGGLLLLVITIVVLRRGSKRRAAVPRELPITLAFPTPVAELERALATPPLSAKDQLALPANNPMRGRVLEMVRNDSDRAAEVFTAWLSEPAPRGAKS